MLYLALEDLLDIRDGVATAARGPIEIMNFHGLLSALAAPRQSAFGAEAFPTLAEKAAALVGRLIRNHPFWDGNKRVATAALLLFLARNGAALAVSDAELRRFSTAIASGALRDREITAWIAGHLG